MTGETTVRPAVRLHGRCAERRAVAALSDRLRTHSAGLVVTGEPGLGRTTLLRWAARTFTAGPVLWLENGTAPHALRALAPDTPVLLCADDVHLWSAPARAALRGAAGTGRTGLLLSVAGHRAADPEFARLPVVRLDPLSPPQAAALLDDATDGAADPAVAAELLAEAEGNPALLLALVGRLSSAELRGHGPLPRPLADAATLAAVAGPALDGLDPDDRDLLLTAAAAVRASDLPDADAGLVHRAVRHLRPTAPEPEPADGRLRLLGSLLRRAAYATADPHRRRAAHAALARATRTTGHRLTGLLHHTWSLADAPGGVTDASGEAAGVFGGVAEVSGREAPDVSVGSAADASGGGPAALPGGGVGDGSGARVSGVSGAREPGVSGGSVTDASGGGVGDLVGEGSADVPGGGAAGLAGGGVAGARRALVGGSAGAALADRLAAEAADESLAASHLLRSRAYARAAELTADAPARAERYTAAAEQALLAGRPDRARPLIAAARDRAAPAGTRGRAELVSGLTELRDGPVGDAHQSLLLAASLLAASAPEQAAVAALAAVDAAWAAGDLTACLATLGNEQRHGEAAAVPAGDAMRDHRLGMRALLEGHRDRAAVPLGHVVDRGRTGHRPEELLRAAAAALLLGEADAARRAGARALAAARHLGSAALVPQALEYLAYAELRAGRHAQARAHAEEGLRTALRAGQRNTAAHHHAVLALAASIEEEPAVVDRHVTAALATARRHGLAQAATLAEWAAGRADLGRGRPLDAADRLGLLVLPGPRRGHFAVWRLAVPCFVEAAALAGRHDDARTLLEDFAGWAAFGADAQAAAQLARCRALLAPPDRADDLYRRALARHDEAGGDFERARTALLYGKWLRRRRRPREARDRLGAALAGFERCGAGVWAQQTRGELRPLGAAPRGRDAGALTRLTPQQLRIARQVAEGATNREVALTLAVSTRTVDYHLRKVFAALGVRSRVELARLVDEAEKTAAEP
ncbi:LuxR C-terminal-related transcriptional regulator [Streptomyces sp. HMX87]|uniref:helix-turn-helix transcriptional regulator n=1 Tax=Streptomyces sp. HMX87 TaxID=3390849 RepID=UPI003A88E066